MRTVFTWLGVHLYVGRVGASLALGQREGRELLAIHEAREPFFLLLFRPEKEKGANSDRVMRVCENRGRGAASTDFLQNLAILHLGKTAAAHFSRCGHAEDADAPESVDHVAGNIRLAIDFLRVEMFVQKDAQLRDGAIDVGLLRVGQAGIRHGPIGHEVPEEKSFCEAKLLPAAKKQLLSLLNLFLPLNVGFGECHRWKR